MKQSLMLSTLGSVVNAQGAITQNNFPEDHPVYTTMGQNAAKLMDEKTDEIWSEDLFTFKHCMDPQYESKVFVTKVDQEEGNKGTFLQVTFLEAQAEKERFGFSSPSVQQSSGIKFGKFLVFKLQLMISHLLMFN